MRSILSAKPNKRNGISLEKMIRYKYLIWITLGLLLIGGTSTVSAYGYATCSSSWGDNSYVHNYYYGEQKAFHQDENIFNYGSTATWDMYSTSAETYTSDIFYTAASNILVGSTLLGYEEDYVEGRTGMRKSGWAPPVSAPIGDGWDVMLFLLILAAGYGLVQWRKGVKCSG